MGLTGLTVSIGLLLLVGWIDISALVLKHFRMTGGPPEDAIYVPQQIVANPAFGNADIVIVGGSSTREFFPGGYDTSTAFSDLCGHRFVAINAATSSQELADSAAIIDAVYATGSKPLLIVVGLTHNRLSHDWKSWTDVLLEQRVALAAATSILEKLPLIDRFVWTIGDKANQLSRLVPILSAENFAWTPDSPPVSAQHFYDMLPMTDAEKRQGSLLATVATDQYLAKDPAHAAQMFAEVFDGYRARGATVVYMFTSMSPVAQKVREGQERHIGVAKAVLEQSGAVLDLRRFSALPEEVFYDEQHLRPEGRERLWAPRVENSQLKAVLCPVP